MPLVSSYTETELSLWLHEELGGDLGVVDAAAVLGWSVAAGSYLRIVAAALRAYRGITTIAEATDAARLEALARVALWRAVVGATAGEHDYVAGPDEMKRSQLQKQATVALALAEAEASSYDSALVVEVAAVRYSNNPYRYLSQSSDADDRLVRALA